MGKNKEKERVVPADCMIDSKAKDFFLVFLRIFDYVLTNIFSFEK